MGCLQYFFDVPVYRVSEEEYENEWMRSSSKKILDGNEEFYLENPDQKIPAQVALRRNFGGIWKYNEII